MTTLIGYRYKRGDMLSRVILIARKLPFFLIKKQIRTVIRKNTEQRAPDRACFKGHDAPGRSIIASSKRKIQRRTAFDLAGMFQCTTSKELDGGFSVGVPPLPIPNREVKPHSADGTGFRWESRSPPLFYTSKPAYLMRAFCVLYICFLSISLTSSFYVTGSLCCDCH